MHGQHPTISNDLPTPTVSPPAIFNMAPTFQAKLQTYRDAAASKFQASRHAPPAPNRPPIVPYHRTLTPALKAYLTTAAARHKSFKQRVQTPASTPRPPKRASPLGRGPIVSALFAHVRKARCEQQVAKQSHLRRAQLLPSAFFVDVVHPCAIPADIRSRAANSFYETRRRRPAAKPMPVGRRLGADCPPRQLPCGWRLHVSRCKSSLQTGDVALQRAQRVHKGDTFADVRARYAGKPDEIYRRKTARRYATWRRKCREEKERVVKITANAELEMKRRRGHDRLLTDRVADDASFAPFLYELNSNAFAFSSKISQAPKLRTAMMNKYSVQAGPSEEPDALEKARLAAENNPLFHTRVMNRFT